jgi:hypothetical protein
MKTDLDDVRKMLDSARVFVLDAVNWYLPDAGDAPDPLTEEKAEQRAADLWDSWYHILTEGGLTDPAKTPTAGGMDALRRMLGSMRTRDGNGRAIAHSFGLLQMAMLYYQHGVAGRWAALHDYYSSEVGTGYVERPVAWVSVERMRPSGLRDVFGIHERRTGEEGAVGDEEIADEAPADPGIRAIEPLSAASDRLNSATVAGPIGGYVAPDYADKLREAYRSDSARLRRRGTFAFKALREAAGLTEAQERTVKRAVGYEGGGGGFEGFVRLLFADVGEAVPE